MEFLLVALQEAWALVLVTAPYLLLGFLLAGVLHVLLPTDGLSRWLGAPRWTSVGLASIVGAPLPLCSCSVVPIAATLRKRGASRGATSAFLISTPETGVDSIALTWALLDPIMTVARPIAAVATAFAAGVSQNLLGVADRAGDGKRAPTGGNGGGLSSETDGDDCCGRPENGCEKRPTPAGRLAKAKEALRFGMVEMFDDLAGYLLVGFLLAGVLAVLLQQVDLLQAALGSSWAPLVMLIAGIPVYVCATSATPLIAVLIAGGLSPGAGLVFLLAGPATNAATIVVLRGILGLRGTVLYVAAIAVLALVCGYILDAIYRFGGFAPRTAVDSSAAPDTDLIGITQLLLALGFCGLLLAALIRKHAGRLRGWLNSRGRRQPSDEPAA